MTPSGDRLLWTIFDWFIRQIPADWEFSCQYRAESSLKNISDHPTLSNRLGALLFVLAAPCGTLAGGSTAATHPSAPSRAQVPHEPSWSASSRSTGRRCSWRGPSLWGSAGESTTRRRRSATYHATHTTAAHVAHRLDTILCAPGDRPLLAVTRLLCVLCVLLRALCCATLTLLDLAVPAGNRRPGRHLASAARAPGRCLVGQATVQERGGQRGTKVASRVRAG